MSLERSHGLQDLDLRHPGELLSSLVPELELCQLVHGAAAGVFVGVNVLVVKVWYFRILF